MAGAFPPGREGSGHSRLPPAAEAALKPPSKEPGSAASRPRQRRHEPWLQRSGSSRIGPGAGQEFAPLPLPKVVQITGHEDPAPRAWGSISSRSSAVWEAKGKEGGEITKNQALVDSQKFLRPTITVNRGKAQLSGGKSRCHKARPALRNQDTQNRPGPTVGPCWVQACRDLS